jgi:hypothetical protein
MSTSSEESKLVKGEVTGAALSEELLLAEDRLCLYVRPGYGFKGYSGSRPRPYGSLCSAANLDVCCASSSCDSLSPMSTSTPSSMDVVITF